MIGKPGEFCIVDAACRANWYERAYKETYKELEEMNQDWSKRFEELFKECQKDLEGVFPTRDELLSTMKDLLNCPICEGGWHPQHGGGANECSCRIKARELLEGAEQGWEIIEGHPV